ncbi:MAG TPA: M48 family metallopeptidase [Blastocatellia bacterium]|nr:M48 family metallopeptidase [Blastocatellia bacterium]
MNSKLLRNGMSYMLAFIIAALPLTTITTTSALAQTQVKTAKSCATPQQDLELGQQAAAEAEKQFQMLNDRNIQEYVVRLGQNLAQYAPGERFPYSFKVVNASEINAFALPGGPTYVNRGTIEAAKNEAELAGVMAHEIAHVALRHGTANVCRAQSYQGVVGILGAVLGGGIAGTAATIGGSILAGSAMMKNSREAETDADVLGSQMMARAGYDPIAMADFFETLAGEQSREPGKLERWFSDHPQPRDRRDRIKKESQLLNYRGGSREIGGFAQVRQSLLGMPKAPSMQQQQTQQQGGQQQPQQGGQPVNVRVDPPSSNLKVFRHQSNAYEIAYPDNWQAAAGNVGLSATLYPNGGAGQQGIVYGVLIDSYLSQNQQAIDPRTRRPRPMSLETSTKEILDNTIKNNNYLRITENPSRTGKVGGRDAMYAAMVGRSPLTNRDERVVMYNLQLNNGDYMYILFVTPNDDFRNYQNLFRRMLQSLRINQ